MGILAEHRAIEKRNAKELARQTQAVLCAVLKKVGPVVLNTNDFEELRGIESKLVEGGIEWKAAS